MEPSTLVELRRLKHGFIPLAEGGLCSINPQQGKIVRTSQSISSIPWHTGL